MKRSTASEAELRMAFQRAYGARDDYSELAAANRIVTAVEDRRPRLRVPRWALSAAAGLATAALGLAVTLVMLSIPRGTAPAAHPSPKPTSSAVLVKQWAIGFVIGGGEITFEGHDLPPNSKVNIGLRQGSVYSEFSTTSDTRGNARVTTPEPAALAPGSADFSICVAPANAAMTCVPERVQVPSGITSVPVSAPSCPPGTQETHRSTPSTNGNYWIGCLGSVTPSP